MFLLLKHKCNRLDLKRKIIDLLNKTLWTVLTNNDRRELLRLINNRILFLLVLMIRSIWPLNTNWEA